MAFTRAGKMEARSLLSDFESESFKSRLQEAQVFDNSVSYFGLNGDFAEGARTCSAALEESESLNEADEFIFQTRGPGPRGVIFLHYDARDVNTQVDEHFSRSLHPPRIYNVQPGEEPKHSDPKPVPMSQRNFPVSFWNPFASNGGRICCQRAAPFIRAPCMPRASILHHPMSTTAQCCEADTCRTSRIHTLSNQSNWFRNSNLIPPPVATSTSALSSSQAQARISAPNSTGSSGCCSAPRFNPQYNQLLIHPDFRSYLPLVPGQPTGSQEKGLKSEGEDFTA